MPTVSVKWQKELFPAVEIDTSQPPYVFKCQLFDLTGVPPERQKIMVKGSLAKDDADWSTLGIKEGQKLMMMGTADEIVKAPEKGPVFCGRPSRRRTSGCCGSFSRLIQSWEYLLHELHCAVLAFGFRAKVSFNQVGRSNNLDQPSHLLTVATRDLFGELDKNVKPVAPMQFWTVIRKKYPQFGQLNNECWTQLLYTLLHSLRAPNSSENLEAVKELFGVELVTSRVHCQESGEESTETESVYSRKCHISHEFNYLHEGLKHVRYSSVCPFFLEKRVKSEGKDFAESGLSIGIGRFYLCSDDLRKQLEAPHQVLRDEEGKKLGLKSKQKSSISVDNDVKMSDAEGSLNGSGESTSAIEGDVSAKEAQMTGVYDLVAVLTHKGRSADSGHYVSWVVKQESGKWIQYDDDNPIPQREEDIIKLSGGGDWHMAYICMYKARYVPI